MSIAPNTARKWVSLLKTAFVREGRTELWRPGQPTGNPLIHHVIDDFIARLDARANSHSVAPVQAPPMPDALLRKIIYAAAVAKSKPSTTTAPLQPLRMAMLHVILIIGGAVGRRGGDVTRIRPHGVLWGPGYESVVCLLFQSKTGPNAFSMRLDPDPLCCLGRALRFLQRAASRAGVDLASAPWLLPHATRRVVSPESSWEPSAAIRLMSELVVAAGSPDIYTLHRLRVAVGIAAVREAQDFDVARTCGNWKSERTIALYSRMGAVAGPSSIRATTSSHHVSADTGHSWFAERHAFLFFHTSSPAFLRSRASRRSDESGYWVSTAVVEFGRCLGIPDPDQHS